MKIETIVEIISGSILTCMAIGKCMVLGLIADTVLRDYSHDETWTLQLITSIGIGLGVLHDLKGVWCIIFGVSDDDESTHGCVDGLVLVCVYITPFVTSCWLSDKMRTGEIVGVRYDYTLGLVLTYWSTQVVAFFTFCVITPLSACIFKCLGTKKQSAIATV